MMAIGVPNFSTISETMTLAALRAVLSRMGHATTNRVKLSHAVNM
jgi:hypothetical protein